MKTEIKKQSKLNALSGDSLNNQQLNQVVGSGYPLLSDSFDITVPGYYFSDERLSLLGDYVYVKR